MLFFDRFIEIYSRMWYKKNTAKKCSLISELILGIDRFIGNKIETIISNGNKDWSNPYDYINASMQEYNELLQHPKETFEYSIKDLIDTNASKGLVSYIEAILCSEINKNFQYDFSTANDYLKNYKEFLIKSDSIFNDYDTYTKLLLD